MRPRVFIGSSSEQRHTAYAVQELLVRDASCAVWDQGAFGLTNSLLDELIKTIQNVDFAIFVFGPDDLVESRDETYYVARDNVVFELGLFTGGLGKERTFFLVPTNGDNPVRLPADLGGILHATYTVPKERGKLLSGLGPACNQFRQMIDRLGVRVSEVESLNARLNTLQTQRDVYAYVFNRLNPYRDINLTHDFLRALPGERQFTRIDDVLNSLETLIYHYVPFFIGENMRTYFAYRLAEPVIISEQNAGSGEEHYEAHYRLGIALSNLDKEERWYEGLPVGVPSNVARAYARKSVCKVRDASRRIDTGRAQNWTVNGEGSVLALPVLFSDDEGRSECVGVVGLSSPQKGEVCAPTYEALAQELGVLFSALIYAYGRYLSKAQSFEDVVERLRREIADHFEWKLGTPC